ncbi:DUF4131 domain-containing protein [bacterium Scap17]|nr:DUF4131 domain-containing protein [bacterium Scap17]
MPGATVNKSSHPARFWLSPASLAQLLTGLVAGIWLSRQGEWGADWQSRSSAGLGAQEGGTHGWAAFMTLSDNLLLAALLLCWLMVAGALAVTPTRACPHSASDAGSRRSRLGALSLRFSAALGGGLLISLLQQPIVMAEALTRQELWLEGRVEQVNRALPTPDESVRLVLRVSRCDLFQPTESPNADAGRLAACHRLLDQRVQLRRYWPHKPPRDIATREALATPWQAGERWRMVVRLVPPHGASNPAFGRSASPAEFDRVAWLWREGIVATGYVRQLSLAQRLAPPGGLAALRLHAEQALWQRCGAGEGGALVDWPGSPCRWLAALTLGKAAALTHDDWDTLNATGLTHLAVVSGLHVGLMASLVLGLSFGVLRLWRPGGWRFSVAPWWLACLAAWSFALLAGLAPPALRAALMVTVGLWMASGRSGLGVWQVWMLALMLVLGLDPLALWRPGTWLSFIAVAVLLLAWQGRSRPRGVRGWCLATLRSQWLLTLVMGAALLLSRGQLSWLSLPMNLLMAPLVTLLIVPLGMLGWGLAGLEQLLLFTGLVPSRLTGMLADGVFSGGLWQLLAQGMAQVMEILSSLASTQGRWPQVPMAAGVSGATPSALILMLAVMALLCAWLAEGVPGLDGRLKRLCGTVALCWGLSLAALTLPWSPTALATAGRDAGTRATEVASFSPGAPALSLTVHDVGQGLAISLRSHLAASIGIGTSRQTPRHWRYDLGMASRHAGARLPGPMPVAGEPIGVIVSHGDGDHAGGLQALSAEEIASLWVPAGQRARLAHQVSWLDEVAMRECVAGRSIILGQLQGEPVRLEMLWPPAGLTTRRDNAHSCVVLIAHGARPLALLNGDIGLQEERELQATLGRRLAGRSLPLLVVAHHGSRTSSGDGWLESLAARHAIVSAGRYNPHGHPHPDVVERLARHVECLWHVGLDGALHWEWWPQGERLQPARRAGGIGVRCLGVKSAG